MSQLNDGTSVTFDLIEDTAEELAQYSIAELVERLIVDEDRAPRDLIDECARRGDAMVDALKAKLDELDEHKEDLSPGEWWLTLHAAMICGLVATESAALFLVDIMRRLDRDESDDMQDWLAGYWPALVRNKPATVVAALKDLSCDPRCDWYMRTDATAAVVGFGQYSGAAELEEALDWLAAFVTDENDDWDFRLCSSTYLLDFPRERYRALLDELAASQNGVGIYYSTKDVENAYRKMKDEPSWGRFQNPWKFYEPTEIAKRQQRWAEQDALDAKEDDIENDWRYEDDDDNYTEPYVREIPKIGRNDSCPCGSGKKYKRCCLH